MSKGLEDCTPFCESFCCTQRGNALKYRTRGGKKEAWCTAFDDVCDGAWCQYSKCAIRKMTDGGKCKGKGVSVASEPTRDNEPVEDPSMIPAKYAKKLRGKLGS